MQRAIELLGSEGHKTLRWVRRQVKKVKAAGGERGHL